MSGHFLLLNIPQTELNTAINQGAIWSPVAHPGVAWDATSRATLDNLVNGVAIPNRGNLPRHCYLQFAGANPVPMALLGYLQVVGWVDNLTRPGGGLNLTGIIPAADVAFAGGRKFDALVAQIQHGAVSVEIYYVSGIPI